MRWRGAIGPILPNANCEDLSEITLCLFHSPYRHRSPAGDFLHVSSLADDRRTEIAVRARRVYLRT